MLKKILFRNSSTTQFLFATLGSLIGLTALLLSIQLILDVNSFHDSEEDLFGPNSVVIQKKVTKLSTIGLNSTEFMPNDIASLKQKEFITDIAPFQSADFKVGISEVEGDGLPHFYADMFFQSIPNRFMDIDVNWDWSEDSEFIPIVLPRDFIMIINYGFAQSQGLNQISEDLLMQARLTIHLEGNNKKEKMIGRVVGFSQKISSILVPDSFLTYANAKFGSPNEIHPNRLFITTKDNSYGELDELMNDMNLDVSESAIDVAKIKTIIAVVIGIFGIASVLIMLLSLLGFVQYSQLVLSKASYEIKTLLRIGYSIKQIVQNFIRQLSVTFGVITLISILIMFGIKFLIINTWLAKNGIIIASSSTYITLFIGILCFVLFIISNYLNIKKTVHKLGSEE
jgi:hypothetical protein